MGRVFSLPLVATAACSFAPGVHATGDGRSAIDSAIVDSLMLDATTDAVPALCNGKVWAADFSSDPTTYDHNGDGSNDFVMRDASAFPGALSNGVWMASGPGKPLDTYPKQNFLTRTVLAVRMRSTQTPPVAGYGGVVWINTGYNGSTFGVLFVDVAQKNANRQDITLYTKPDVVSTQVLSTVVVQTTAMLDIMLDINPIAHTFVFVVNGGGSSGSFPTMAVGGNDDRFATAVAYGANTEFDNLRIEVCP